MNEALTGLIKFLWVVILCYYTGNVFYLTSRFLNTISQESISNSRWWIYKEFEGQIFILIYLKTIIKGVGVFGCCLEGLMLFLFSWSWNHRCWLARLTNPGSQRHPYIRCLASKQVKVWTRTEGNLCFQAEVQQEHPWRTNYSQRQPLSRTAAFSLEAESPRKKKLFISVGGIRKPEKST